MSGFDTYALCPCGEFRQMPFGDWLHVHATVCGGCGRPIHASEKVVGRPVGTGFLGMGRKVLVGRDGEPIEAAT